MSGQGILGQDEIDARINGAKQDAPPAEPSAAGTHMTSAEARTLMSSEPVRLNDCTIRTIPTLHEELVRRLSETGPVSVDRTGIQRPNTELLQLLAAFVRDLRSQSRAIQWLGESAAFDRAARVLGLSSSLGLPADG